MLLYCHTTTPRLQYVVYFLSRYYGTAIWLTTNETDYRTASEACKINYSTQQLLETEIRIEPHPLLFEKGIKPVAIDCFDYNDRVVFFKTNGTIPFDLFAAIFYLLSRYEEYGPHQKDMYGRYAHENSLAFKHNFLKTPLINSWLEDFRKLLIQKDQRYSHRATAFSFEPTYDIDIAWSYKAKGWKRTAGGLLSAALHRRGCAFLERIRTLRGACTDPYDAYDWLDVLHHRYELKPLYFFLVAQRRSRLDKNSSVHSPLFQNLIAHTAIGNRIGLHPSWQSGDNKVLLQNEKEFLEMHAQQAITTSRQHYIRFTLPHTYRRLISAGITDDYSMGYGSINGFRASVATPFFWYDLEREEKTTLLVHPFCFMDANSYYEQKQSAEETAAELNDYYKCIKAVDATMCTIWHNHFLGSDAAFAGWRNVYEHFVVQACT